MGDTYFPLQSRGNPAVLSIVIPVYNEQAMIPILRGTLSAFADGLLASHRCAARFVLVNDGSSDRSIDLLLDWAAADSRVTVIGLARNFGHQAAITAGLDAADGDAAVVMDADLQDPPSVVPAMLDRYAAGYDVVYGRRLRRRGQPPSKKLAGWLYYRAMRSLVYRDLPIDTGDFRLMSRRCVAAIKQMREPHRFVRGMVAWLGYPHTFVEYERPPRAAGETKYPWRKLARLAWDGAINFSPLPLRISLWLGTIVLLFAAAMVAYALATRLGLFGHTIPGWTSQVIIQCLVGGAILVSNGLMGEYVARTFEAGKGRPLYVVAIKKRGDGGDAENENR